MSSSTCAARSQVLPCNAKDRVCGTFPHAPISKGAPPTHLQAALAVAAHVLFRVDDLAVAPIHLGAPDAFGCDGSGKSQIGELAAGTHSCEQAQAARIAQRKSLPLQSACIMRMSQPFPPPPPHMQSPSAHTPTATALPQLQLIAVAHAGGYTGPCRLVGVRSQAEGPPSPS